MTNADEKRSGSEKDQVKTEQAKMRSDVVDALCKQLEPCIPIRSFGEVVNRIKEITVGSTRIPLEMLAAHVGDDAFPINNARDLKKKVTEGVERAISLGRSSSSPRRPRLFDQALGAMTQREAKIGLRVPAIYRTYFPEPTDRDH
jgi:hypothetical protein